MSEVKLSDHFITQAKEKYGEASVKAFKLINADTGEVYGTALFRKPEPWTLKTFYKLLRDEPIKARRSLISGTIIECEMKDVIDKAETNSDLFSAAFDASSEMLPGGKAEAVEI